MQQEAIRIYTLSEIQEQLASAELRLMFPSFVCYARNRMRLLRRREPTAEEVDDLVQDVLEAALRGGREWPVTMSMWKFLNGVVWSVLDHRCRTEQRRRQAAVAVPFDAVAEPAAPASRRAQRIDARHCIATIEDYFKNVAPDPELSALIAAVLDENEAYSEIAEVLGCNEARVDVLFRRLRRKIDAAGLHLWSQDE